MTYSTARSICGHTNQVSGVGPLSRCGVELPKGIATTLHSPAGLRLTMLVVTTAMWSAGEARADPWFQNFPDEQRRPAIGAWLTTVVRADGQSLSDRPAWSETVVAIATPRSTSALTTGSVPRGAQYAQYAAAAGPRLTGHGHALSGNASYYWEDQTTATGERFDKRAMTAAHKTLPFGTKVRVTRVDNGASVIVRINDRGPFRPGRIIDLSERAAENLRMTTAGVAAVRLEVLGR